MPYLELPDGTSVHYRGKAPLGAEERALLIKVAEAARAQYDHEASAAPAPRLHPLYTLGYQGSSLADMRGYLADLGAMLVDIRFNPWSPNPAYRSASLREAVGRGNYTYLHDLGNPNYRGGGPMTLLDPAAALDPMRRILAVRPAILLCACRGWFDCHRRLAASYLAVNLGVTVTHLPGRRADWHPPTNTAEAQGEN